MSYSRKNWLHNLEPKVVLDILHNGAWTTMNQSISSAVTNDNNLTDPDDASLDALENTAGVNAFADITFLPSVKTILDVGGGRFDVNVNFMLKKGIKLQVWDPYNRSAAHNNAVRADTITARVDAVTSMSVLNVIPECESRLAHIITVYEALKINGKAYFKIWPGEGLHLGTNVSTQSENAYQANAKAERFLREIEVVFGSGTVTIDSEVPNLIIANKTSDQKPTLEDVLKIQVLSRNEEPLDITGKKLSFFTTEKTGVHKIEGVGLGVGASSSKSSPTSLRV